jgi:ADP-ribose pyrophosphatase YjhB (NUDIX family)
VEYRPQSFPVSVKGVVIRDGQVLLLRNERDEWEIPGGKLELGEGPESCVAREISEEVGWTVATGSILDAWQFHIRDGVDVLIVTYGCHSISCFRSAGWRYRAGRGTMTTAIAIQRFSCHASRCGCPFSSDPAMVEPRRCACGSVGPLG